MNIYTTTDVMSKTVSDLFNNIKTDCEAADMYIDDPETFYEDTMYWISQIESSVEAIKQIADVLKNGKVV